jgi:hypothetical protein
MTARKATPLKAVPGGKAPARGTARTRSRKPSDPPPPPEAPKPPVTVKAAAETGSRRDLLVAMRNRIATDIDAPNTPPRDLAALSRRLLEIAKDIEALDAAEKADDVGTAAATPDEEWAAT